MSHTIKHVWAARDMNKSLWIYEQEPEWNRNQKGFYCFNAIGDSVDEEILSMPFIAPGEKKKVTISVTAD